MRLPWRRRPAAPEAAPAPPTPAEAAAAAQRPLRWIEVDAADADAHAGAVDDIFARRLDGMTITGIFTPEECQRAVERLEGCRSERVASMFGTVLGPPVSMRPTPDPGPEHREDYLAESARSQARYDEAFGFDPFSRVAAAVGPMAGGRHLGPPIEHGQRYKAGNVRWYEPGRGGLPAHAGNEFPMHHDNSLWHLRQMARTEDHLSWFAVLQQPEEGGQLSVYDLLYEDPRPEVGEWGNAGREDRAFDTLPCTRIDPTPGGMVLFGGGWRWHRVEPIGGTRERVTYGGFACRSHDDGSIYFWI